ncbi:hypothetical protein PIB30_005342 [Stylosanthes scabra]|uniref:Man1/Src1-like C-terminal domain-containing protein n=1 Tax=Stylosanthes scabra TaxID=79078 RepID=A0ABU6V5E6_9FABA|nr:hypothetical protein [Stylosanthes scabra]
MNRGRERKSKTSSPSLIPMGIEPPRDLLPSKHDFPKLLLVLAISCLVAFSCNLFFTSFVNPPTKPFCDSILIDSLPSFSDDCEPCPAHGECYAGILECFKGYRRHRNFCVEDSEISESARKIAERVEFHLCEEYAQFMCYETGSIWVREDEFWNRLEPFGDVLLDNVLYNFTKEKAVESISKSMELRLNSHGVKEYKCPDLLAQHYKPYACRVRQWILQNILLVLPVFAMLVLSTTLFWNVRRKLRISKRVEELYNQVCEILEDNALTAKSANDECEPWVVASRLRDHLLLPRERKDPLIWKKVEELVQEDSRVDRYPKLVKGESKVVWEWQVEGSLSASKMKNKRDASKMRVNEGINHNYQKQAQPIRKAEHKEPPF